MEPKFIGHNVRVDSIALCILLTLQGVACSSSTPSPAPSSTGNTDAGTDASSNPGPARGEVIEATKVKTFSTVEMGLVFSLGGFQGTPKYAVDAYKVVYGTVDEKGGPGAIASGAIFIPVGMTAPAPLVAYAHGTVVARTGVPSVEVAAPPAGSEAYIGAVFASQGYVASLGDYLGLGMDNGRFHPFIHAQSEASATIDCLRAMRSEAAALNVALNGQVFLSGYSEGGHAIAATLRELQTNDSDEFAIVATSAWPLIGSLNSF